MAKKDKAVLIDPEGNVSVVDRTTEADSEERLQRLVGTTAKLLGEAFGSFKPHESLLIIQAAFFFAENAFNTQDPRLFKETVGPARALAAYLRDEEIVSLSFEPLEKKKKRECGKCGAALNAPGPCAVCNDEPFGARR